MSATIDMSAVVSKQDVSALMRQMRRAEKDIGMSLGQSVKLTAWAVADALRAATKVSDKRRKVVEDLTRGIRGLRKPFIVQAIRKNKEKEFPIRATSKREANAHRVAQIGNRGLAQRAWLWAQGHVGARRGGGKVGAKTAQLAEKYTSVQVRVKGNDPMVRIDNRLPYALDAFKSSGEQTVSNAMERASRRMMHIIDAKIAKKLGAK
jgi:predicted TIM-barrel enzyme